MDCKCKMVTEICECESSVSIICECEKENGVEKNVKRPLQWGFASYTSMNCHSGICFKC